MATFNPEEWTQGFDEFGRPCWCHKVTMSQVYHQFPTATPAGPSAIGPMIPTAGPFHPAPGVTAKRLWEQALAGAWKEYETDGEGGKKKTYWYNTVSGETTWEKPNTNEGKPPPPPAPPAKTAEPKEPAAPVKKEREKDQWKQLRNERGRKYWHNEKTVENTYDMPDCLKKYRRHV